MATAAGRVGWQPELNSDERELDLLETSWADFANACRTGGSLFMRDGTAIEKWGGDLVQLRQQFDAYRQRHKDGDATALLGALQLACAVPVPLPYWLALELRRRLGRVWSEEVSLHEAMGLTVALPATGKKARAARLELQQRKTLYRSATALMHGEGLSLTAALQRLRAERALPFGLTKARELYEEQDRVQRVHLGKRPRRRAVK